MASDACSFSRYGRMSSLVSRSSADSGCSCGAIRYEARWPPLMVATCSCKNCQKQAGTAFGTVVGIPKLSLSIQGRLKTFHDIGDSGQPVNRNFCPECGSPITTDLAATPELTFIKAGSLPPIHRYVEELVVCVSMDSAATLFVL